MDSLTQITLGAALGEAALGKKVGRRAMLWGAIGGTIPDIDVFAGFSADGIGALAFHRAITHSAAFTLAIPFLLGWLVHRLYKEKYSARQHLQDILKAGAVLWLGITVASLPMLISASNLIVIGFAVTTGILIFPTAVFLREQLRKQPAKNGNATVREWTILFLLALFTHPLLDCCTTYGTQFFRPFSDYRVALNNISVVDPFYTVPFLICVLIALFLRMGSVWRKRINYLGIILSCSYLLFSFYNKWQVDRIFEQSLKAQKIAFTRFTTSPTIFNNILWQGIAEGDSVYYHGFYSLLDKKPVVEKFATILKNHEWLSAYEGERDLKILKWFSDGYYNVVRTPGGNLQFNDLRFGSIGLSFEDHDDYVFRFRLKEQDGHLSAHEIRERPKMEGNPFGKLWKRILGNP